MTDDKLCHSFPIFFYCSNTSLLISLTVIGNGKSSLLIAEEGRNRSVQLRPRGGVMKAGCERCTPRTACALQPVARTSPAVAPHVLVVCRLRVPHVSVCKMQHGTSKQKLDYCVDNKDYNDDTECGRNRKRHCCHV